MEGGESRKFKRIKNPPTIKTCDAVVVKVTEVRDERAMVFNLVWMFKT